VSASLDAYDSSAATATSGADAPYVDVTLAAISPPQINSQYPPDNYDEPTLTPELVATGTEASGAPSALTYSFAVYSASGTEVASVSSRSSGDWTVPTGALSWNQTYYWTVTDYDGEATSTTQTISYFSTPVSQPLVTSSLSQQDSGPGFDPSTGDWTTTATDAQVATVGPALEIVRDYNSEDPRSNGAFGAGWSSLLDMAVRPGQPNTAGTTQTEVVTYPDGEEVGYGLNSDGSYTPPPGRYAELRSVSGGFTLTDKNDTVYTFTQALSSGGYGITSITDANKRTETFTWNGTSQITQVTSASGRTLSFTWEWLGDADFPHVSSVTTNDVTSGASTSALTWTYTYNSDALTGVCAPGSNGKCTAYNYQQGSDYQNAVLDSGPRTYLRMDDAAGSSDAASSVLVNEGTDNAPSTNVTFGQDAGPLTGQGVTAALFNGSSSYVSPVDTSVNQAQYQSVSLWFKTTTAGGVLYSASVDALAATTSNSFDPVLYIGSDGKLEGEFYNGSASPMSSAAAVDDGQWHNVVITDSAAGEVLYLDGAQVGTPLTTGLSVQSMTHLYVGAGYLGSSWPDESHQNQSGGYESFFNGDISDVATWSRQLDAADVSALYKVGTGDAELLTSVTRPSGSVYAKASYNAGTGRVTSVTDANGGTWGVAAPSVQGSSQVYVASVLGSLPGDYYRLDDTNPTNPDNEVNGGVATYNDVTEGVTPGLFADEPVDSFNGSSSYLAMPQGLTYQDGNESVGLWFKTTTAGGTLFSASANPIAATTTGDYSGGLYVGSDGKLVGAFFDGNAADVVESSGAVDDGKWHFAVLAADPTGQALYLDGNRVGTLSAGLDSNDQSYEYVGAGFLGGAWPDESHNDPGSDTGYASYFNGDIAEVAWVRGSLTQAQVSEQYSASKYSTGLTPLQLNTVTDPGGKKIDYQYDPLNADRLVSQTNGDGNTTAYGYDENGFQDRIVNPAGDTTDYGYDVRGNVIAEQTCQDQAAGVCSTSRWTYYPDDTNADPPADPRNDLLLSYFDPRTGDNTTNTQYLTTYTYDPAGNLTRETSPPVTGFPDGKNTAYAYTDGTTTAGGYGGAVPPAGLPYQETSPGGAVTTTLYDAAGDVMQVTNPDGEVTNYAYDGVGREMSKTVVSDSYPSGLMTTYAYNGTGQVTTETDPEVMDQVTGAQHTAVTTTSYDADGDVLSQVVADSTGGDASRSATYTYNGNDLVETAVDPANGKTSYTYDSYGDVASETDADGNVYDYSYDADGNLLTQTLENYNGSATGTTAGPLVETSRTYNPAGQLASVTDAMNYVTSYGYTDNGLVASVTRSDPSTGDSYAEETNTYDAAGNLVKQVTDNGGTETDDTVSADNQVTSQVLDPNNLDRVTSYTYTPDDNVLTKTVSNGATAVNDGQPSGPVQVTGYAYDGTGSTAAQFVYGDSDSSLAPSGWWPLGDGTSTSSSYSPVTAADESGNGNTAVVPSGVSWSGSGASFNGNTTSYPAIETSGPVVDTSGSFTVSAWVDVTGDAADTQGIVAEHSAQEDGFRLDYSNGSWQFARAESDASGTPSFDVASSSGASTGTWEHLVGTYDSSTGAMILYVNGQETDNATDSTPFAASGPVAIGNLEYEGGEGNPLDGQVANVQVYPYALSADQVSSLHSEGQYGSPVGMDGTATTWSLDERGLPTSMTDPDGNTTTYLYDQAGRLAVTTSPSVTVEKYNASTQTDTTVSARPVTRTGYDTFGDKSETQDANGNVTTYGYDGDGRQTLETAPDYTPADGSGPYTVADGTSAKSSMTYTGDGQVASATDPMNHTTTYKYDQLGDLTSQTAPDQGVTTSTYDPNGDQLTQTGPTGAETESTYDYLGRRLTSTQMERYPSAASYTTNYSYTESSNDPGGAWPSSVTTPDGMVTEYGYDAAGEEAWSADDAGNVTDYWYDALGRRYMVVNPDGSAVGTSYDVMGDPVQQTNYDTNFNTIDSTSATYDGDGDMTSSTDANGHTTDYSYDPTGMLTQEVQPVSATSSITTSFGYDANGNETRYTDGNGNKWYYTWTPWGQKESEAEPATSQYSSAANSTFTTSYNADAAPVTETEPGGVSVTSSYDNMGDLTGQTGTGATATTATRSFTYDDAGEVKSASTTNTASSGQTSNATSESFNYNDRGEVLNASGSGGSTTYGYNGDGLVTSVADAAGMTSYTYDAADRLQTLSDPASGTTLTYNYNDMSQVSGISYGTGNTETFNYDNLHRLYTDTLASSSGSTVASLTYGYDGDNNITSIDTTGLAGASSNAYTYDYADRLTSWNNGTATTSYGYDAAGNLTQAGSKTYKYDARDELTSDGTSTYTYSANGTMESAASSAGTANSTFDAYGDQVTSGTQTYSYDALGRVMSDAGSGQSYAFSYQGASQAMASDGAYDYTWDPSGTSLIGIEGAASGSGGSGVLALANQHGDVVGQFTATGTSVQGSRAYDPWGTVLTSTGTVKGNLGYQSGWTDTATGKVAMGARWYSPATGNFTSRDTAQVAQSPASGAANPFGYATDNPLKNADPSGHLTTVYGSGLTLQQAAVQQAVAQATAKAAPNLSALEEGVSAAESALGSLGDLAHSAWDFVTGNLSGAKAEYEAALNRAKQALAKAMSAVDKAVAAARAEAIKSVDAIEAKLLAEERSFATAVADAKKKLAAAAETVVTKAVSAGARVYHTVTTYAKEGAKAVVHAVGTAANVVTRAATATASFVKNHAAAIASIATSVAVMVGCEATVGVVTGGTATEGCAAVAGAAGSAVGYAVNAAQHGGFSWSGLGKAALTGAVTGLALGGLGSLAGSIGKGLVGGLLTSGEDAADSAISSAVDEAGSSAAGDGSAVAGGGDTATVQAGGDATEGTTAGAADASGGSGTSASSDAGSSGDTGGSSAASSNAAEGAGGATVRDFAHGTSLENAQSILNNGLNEGAARAASSGGRYAQRGSFFSFEVTPSNTEGLQLAYEMGLKQEGECVVLVCRLPASTVSELENAGLVRTGAIPGVSIPETVFSPGAFARINDEATWQLIKP